jgi:CRISPR/Cas system CSM-associated protein Csm4 (group 5 of RAMP superfamily)
LDSIQTTRRYNPEDLNFITNAVRAPNPTHVDISKKKKKNSKEEEEKKIEYRK